MAGVRLAMLSLPMTRAADGSLGIVLSYSAKRPPVVAEADGAARRAGMLPGDVLVGIDGVAVPAGRQMASLLPHTRTHFVFTVKRAAPKPGPSASTVTAIAGTPAAQRTRMPLGGPRGARPKTGYSSSDLIATKPTGGGTGGGGSAAAASATGSGGGSCDDLDELPYEMR